MDVPGMVMTSSSEPVLKSVGGRRVVNEPQKLHRKIKDNRITAEYLREHCRRHDLYMTPRFNTVLYLHHKVHHLRKDNAYKENFTGPQRY